MKRFVLTSVVLFSALVMSGASYGAVVFDWAQIGNTDNVADTQTGYGAVNYEYSIATTEVTTAQYVEFLNAVAGVDTYGLYNSSMSNSNYYKGISITSGSGTLLDPYEYNSNTGWENRPVVYVSWYDTLRFTNWLHNGQLSGAQDATTTEYGAYDMSLGSSVVRLAGADYWLPSENEWYKAAYYDPVAGLYYDYATSSDDLPVAGVDANYNDGGYVEGSPYYSTEVGEYDNESPYGTYEQSGNVWEWNEALISGQYRGMRGGSWFEDEAYLPAFYRYDVSLPTYEYPYTGFRVASSFTGDDGAAVPEPLSVGLVLLSVGGLVLRRAKRA